MSSYYDIESILTEAEKVPCQFHLDVADLGHLDNSSGVKYGTTMALPLWLAETLAICSMGPMPGPNGEEGSPLRGPVALKVPPALRPEVLAALKADPRAVPVRDQSAHFYAFAAHLLEYFDAIAPDAAGAPPDDAELAAVLRRTWVGRAGEVALHARKAGEESAAVGSGGAEEFLRGLDEWERVLFRRAHEGVRGVKDWMDTVKRH